VNKKESYTLLANTCSPSMPVRVNQSKVLAKTGR
jgi:hypothetical protein